MMTVDADRDREAISEYMETHIIEPVNFALCSEVWNACIIDTDTDRELLSQWLDEVVKQALFEAILVPCLETYLAEDEAVKSISLEMVESAVLEGVREVAMVCRPRPLRSNNHSVSFQTA